MKKDTHVGLLLTSFQSTDIDIENFLNNMSVLLYEKTKNNEGQDLEVSIHKSIGITLSKCVDEDGKSYIDDRASFLIHLASNLHSSYNFSHEAASEVLDIERNMREEDRTREQRALIVASLAKAHIYPLNFTEEFTMKERVRRYGAPFIKMKRHIYASSKALRYDNRVINAHTYHDDNIHAQDLHIVKFLVKDACTKLFQMYNVHAPSFLGMSMIVNDLIKKEASEDQYKKIGKEFQEFIRLLGT